MKKNMGSVDKIVRLIIATVIGFLYYTGVISGTLGLVLFLLAVVLIVTSFISFCPLYKPFGFSSCSVKEK